MTKAPPMHTDPTPTAPAARTPLASRALLALAAAVTIAVAPVAAAAFGLAGTGHSAHSIPAYLLARLSHDVGHNDWAFQGQDSSWVQWVAPYVGLGLFWLGIALWMRARGKKAERLEFAVGDGANGERARRLWLRVLLAAWGTEAVLGCLTIGTGLLARYTSISLSPDVLRAADLFSPWWSCVAAILVVAKAERSRLALYAAAGYGLLLVLVLEVKLPGPDAVKALLLVLPVAVPALLTGRRQEDPAEAPAEPDGGPVTPDAVAAG